MPRTARIAPKEYVYHIVYAYGKKDTLIEEHPIYKELSKDKTERRRKYREFVKGMLIEKNVMKGEMTRRVVYGSEDFIKGVTKEYKIDAVIKPKGRPKKNENENRTVPFLKL